MRLSGTADVINVWHAQITGYMGGSDAQVAQELVDEISTNYQLIDQDIAGTASVDMSVVNVTTGAVLGSMAWNPVLGAGSSGDQVPPQASMFCYFRTGFSRRIGRKFVGTVNEASQNNGIISAGVITALGNFAAAFLGPIVGATTGNTYRFGVYNPNKSPTFLMFVEYVVRNYLATQRRRRFGVGS
jgi:hypothetical protein